MDRKKIDDKEKRWKREEKISRLFCYILPSLGFAVGWLAGYVLIKLIGK